MNCDLKVGIHLSTQIPNCTFKIGAIYCICMWVSVGEGVVVFSFSRTDVRDER